MKSICTIASTRPELIRLSRIIAKLDKACNHTLIYTGQNYDPKLSTIFFDELGIRKPNLYIEHKYDTFGEQLGHMLNEVEKYLTANRPDKVLILGDTNGCLCAIIAKKLGITLVHMEAGNRCGEWINEEINRHIVDSISDIHLPYTEHSRRNLIADGVNNHDIFVVGNPIAEVLKHYNFPIVMSNILKTLNLEPQAYFLATFHRNENVTDEGILKHIIHALNELYKIHKLPIICSIHPKTHINLTKFGIAEPQGVRFIEPLGLFDFVCLEIWAKLILTDSGTVPEEATIWNVRSVMLRNSTERPELIECGSTMLCGTKSTDIVEAVNIMMNSPNDWKVPAEYQVKDVSDRVVKLLLGETK